MTRIDCLDSTGQFKPIGAFSSFSVHPNAVPYGLCSNGLYNGEVFAYMEREVEWAIWERYRPQGEAVHVAVNGTQADNSSDSQLGKQEFIEAKRIGTAIERKAFELFFSLDGTLTDDAAVQSIVREIDAYENPCIDGECLCERPVAGNTLTTRAEDCQSLLLPYLPILREGSPRWIFTRSCQGHKWVVGTPLQYLILPKEEFPPPSCFSR
jgi:neutral ceramidase